MAGSAGITRDEILKAIEGDGRFFVVVSVMRRMKGDLNLDDRIVDRALQRERRAGAIESVGRRWVRVRRPESLPESA